MRDFFILRGEVLSCTEAVFPGVFVGLFWPRVTAYLFKIFFRVEVLLYIGAVSPSVFVGLFWQRVATVGCQHSGDMMLALSL